MESDHPSLPQQRRPKNSSPKLERRIIEKNRRKHLKELYFKLYSLLPTYSSTEPLSVPEQVDEAVNYIKSLQERVEKSKENLLRKKRRRSCVDASEKNEITSSSRVPQLEIQEIGPSMDVILISGLEKQSTFYSILRFLAEEGFEAVNANFSSCGNSMLQVAHAKVGKSAVSIRATTVIRRLKELIYGNQQKDQLEPMVEDLWDFQIEPHIWDFEFLDTMPMLGVGDVGGFNRV